MTFPTLALIVAVALIGPLLAWSDRLRIPVVLGELAAGIIVGHTGFNLIDPTSFTFLANLGFAMVMFEVGSHVPVRDRSLHQGTKPALYHLALVTVLSIGLAWVVARLFGTGHVALYAVLFASSSAAVILPAALSMRIPGSLMVRILPQVAIADAACIVALPLVIDPAKAGTAALGALAVIGCGVGIYFLLRESVKRGWGAALHKKSSKRGFALELRISLLLLLLLAALAVGTRVSIMLAGFVLGLVVAAVGAPRRLARQLFGLTEGLFAPIFYVWLGASLDLRNLGTHPSMIALGVALAAGAVLAHASAAIFKQPLSLAVLASAQLGVPVAAATLGDQLDLLAPGEDAALLLGALLTIVAATIGGRLSLRLVPASRKKPTTPAAAPSTPRRRQPRGAGHRKGSHNPSR